MDFATYVKQSDRGLMATIMRVTGLSYSSILRARRGDPVGYRVAVVLSGATDGAVSVDELCAPQGGAQGPESTESGKGGGS